MIVNAWQSSHFSNLLSFRASQIVFVSTMFLSSYSLVGCSTREMPTVVVAIAVSPDTVQPGGSAILSASVSGKNISGAWSVIGGTANGSISTSGRYSAPSTLLAASDVLIDFAYQGETTHTIIHVNPKPTLSLSTPNPNLLGGEGESVVATLSSNVASAVDWFVNGVPGGSASTGVISAEGTYTAPQQLNAMVSVSAHLHEDPTVQGSISINVVSPVASQGSGSFAFSLSTPARTSAGVYDRSGHLIRTLWSNRDSPAGPQVAMWDGRNDLGVAVSPGTYGVRVLHNNVSYSWGVIGDTSDNLAGPNNWDTQATFPRDAVIVGGEVYTANGYAEGRPNASTFSFANPQEPTALFTLGQNVWLQFAASDGQLVYFSNQGDAWGGSTTFTLAYNPSTHKQYQFPRGVTAPNGNAPLVGVVDLDPGVQTQSGSNRSHLPTGLAVQKTGPILAISHGSYHKDSSSTNTLGDNKILLFDKVTGSAIGSINVDDPQRIAFAEDGALWVVSGTRVLKFGSVGNANTLLFQLSDLVMPRAIAVDPTTNDVLVADGGSSQQVKRFASDGVLLSVYGDAGGYTDCNPTVSASRLFLDSTAGVGSGNAMPSPGTWLAVAPDSSFWVGDLGNSRALRISAAGINLDQVSFITDVYAVATDHNVPSRVFADFLEYSVDYSKDLLPGNPEPSAGGNGSWRLARNWSVCAPPQYLASLVRVNTFPSGRTYAELPNSSTKSKLTGSPLLELVELPSTGPIMPSGIQLTDAGYNKYLDDNGDLTYWEESQSPTPTGTTTMIAYQQKLITETQGSWPQWGVAQVIATATGQGTPRGSVDPIGFGGWGMNSFPKATNGGILATYSTVPSTPGQDFHLGGVRAGDRDWSWKTSRGALLTVPDDQGTFTDVNSFGGHNGIAALVEGSYIFQGYDGQYGNFSSQWMQWNEDGLLVGQFGHPASGASPDGSLYLGAAGNIASMTTVTVGDSIYLYNSDESYHPGVHRWKIDGLDSVGELRGDLAIGGTVVLQ